MQPLRITINTTIRLAGAVILLGVGGCATFDGFVDGLRSKSSPPTAVVLEDLPRVDPIDANTFFLSSSEQTIIGTPQIVFTKADDTFSDLARTYGLGYDELVAANPDIDPWLPGENAAVLLPTQFILPKVPKRGVILNIATKRLFYFPESGEGEPQKVLTYPIGIGRVGWETPLGETTVIAKAKDPSWWVPASVRREHAEMGDPLPSVVPPGPDNPLGTRVLKLNMPGYLIHGTNQPYGVGMRVSHGCVRLYPENIEYLYTLVDIGEVVSIVNEPFQIGRAGDAMFFEAHTPLEDDAVVPAERLQALLDQATDTAGQPLNEQMKDYLTGLAAAASGLPANIASDDSDEWQRRVRVVHNTVERDPNEPTLLEVRELMDDAEDEDETSL